MRRMTRGRCVIPGLIALLAGAGCGASVDLGGGGGLDSGSCAAFAAPGTSAPCSACSAGSSSCQANGCYNGYLCDVAERDCKAPGTACSSTTNFDAHEQ